MTRLATVARLSAIPSDQSEQRLETYVRPARAADARHAGAICYEAFKAIAERHGFPPDFPTREAAVELLSSLIPRTDVHSVVAEREGRVLGSNFLWKGAVAGIGPITVDTGAQNSGVGRRLMEAVIDLARRDGSSAIRLVQAAYHSRSLSLYTKLGFVAREPLSLIQGRTLRSSVAGRSIRTATGSDLSAMDTLCRNIHGHDRAAEIRHAVSKNAARVVEQDGRITGYATEIGFFGHAVGETTDDVKALIADATTFSGPGFLLPTRNSDLLHWCIEHGLRVVQPMTLMSMGDYQEPQGAFLPSILF